MIITEKSGFYFHFFALLIAIQICLVSCHADKNDTHQDYGTLTINYPDLVQLSPAELSYLEHLFWADPRWKVGLNYEVDGRNLPMRYAQRMERCKKGSGNSKNCESDPSGFYYEEWNGDHPLYDSNTKIEDSRSGRAIIGFGAPFYSSNEKFYPCNSGKIKIPIRKNKWGYPHLSGITIVFGNHFYLYIGESAHKKDLKFTQSVIDDFTKTIRQYLAEYREQKQASPSEKIDLEETFIRHGLSQTQDKSSLEILNQDETSLSIHAWINPLEAGEVFLKIIDKKGKPFYDPSFFKVNDSLRYVGWHHDAKRKFYFHFPLMQLAGALGNKEKAFFQIWFRNFSGNEKMLLEESKTVYRWEPY